MTNLIVSTTPLYDEEIIKPYNIKGDDSPDANKHSKSSRHSKGSKNSQVKRGSITSMYFRPYEGSNMNEIKITPAVNFGLIHQSPSIRPQASNIVSSYNQVPSAPHPSNLSTPSTMSPLFPQQMPSPPRPSNLSTPSTMSPLFSQQMPSPPRPSKLSTPSTMSPLFPQEILSSNRPSFISTSNPSYPSMYNDMRLSYRQNQIKEAMNKHYEITSSTRFPTISQAREMIDKIYPTGTAREIERCLGSEALPEYATKLQNGIVPKGIVLPGINDSTRNSNNTVSSSGSIKSYKDKVINTAKQVTSNLESKLEGDISNPSAQTKNQIKLMEDINNQRRKEQAYRTKRHNEMHRKR